MRLLVEPKNRRAVSKERGNSTSLPFSPSQYRFWSAQARLRFETRTATCRGLQASRRSGRDQVPASGKNWTQRAAGINIIV